MTDDSDRRFTRRRFSIVVGGSLASAAFGEGCLVATKANDGRLTARPHGNSSTTLDSGPLGLSGSERDGMIQMPSAIAKGKMPLLVFLHGATQRGVGMLRRIGPAADQAGVAVLAPDSRDVTWDAIHGSFGDDVSFLNRAIEHVFDRLAVDPDRLAIGGFSDGASYALSLGLANGDLFSHVIACSPGFIMSAPPHGHSRFFVSHGTSDQILPVDQSSRVIVPRLQSMGFDVTYREFDGRHELPPEVAVEAMRWLSRGTDR